MSPIDLLPRNLTRSVDPQALRDAPTGAEAGEGSSQSQGTDGFESLLDGLTERRQNEGEKAQSPDLADTLLQPNENNAAVESAPDIAGAVFTLLEGFLPKASPQSAAASSAGQGQSSGNSPLPNLQDLQPGQDGPELAKTPLAPRMLVSVQHQETHFSPVIDSSDTSLAPDLGEDQRIAADVVSTVQAKTPSQNIAPQGLQKPLNDLGMRNAAAPLSTAPVPVRDNIAAEQQVDAPSFDTIEAIKPRSAEANHAEPQGLPTATLQRLANVMEADLRALSTEASLRAPPSDGTSRSISIKASESALRVLNLQLHPAELGTVTVKMRLAGETLEMELHVEKEETAKMLRHDSEKLSALLRGSGYRPDVISIQVADGTNQDRSAASRQQGDMQFQGQSFAQGGASQDERSRNRDEAYAGARVEQHKNADEDSTLGGNNRGGVYL